MKKIIATLLLFTVFYPFLSHAQIETPDIKSNSSEKLRVTGFPDYFPFGEFSKEDGEFHSVFLPFLDTFIKEADFYVEYTPSQFDYANTIREAAKKGKSDLILGIYNDTSLYKDLKYIYPAAIINPVHVVMLPSRIGELKSVQDLQKLKGAIHKKDIFSDYQKKIFAPYQLETVDNSYDLFGKLMTGEIDYIFTTLYFGIIESTKLGIRHQIAFSKQSLWRIPMFIGLSKLSSHREYLSKKLSKSLEQKETRDKIQQHMMEIIHKIEEENKGVVPPSYSLENK